MRSARDVLLTAYTLRPGLVLDSLEDAARRGARVTVRLEGSPYADTSGELTASNKRVVRDLRRLGADAKLVDTNERNWPDKGDNIVRDDFRADVSAVRAAALTGRASRSAEFSTSKRDALWSERRLLDSARDAKRVDVESESFGAGSGVYGALKKLAQSGVSCRLIVSRRDLNPQSQRALSTL